MSKLTTDDEVLALAEKIKKQRVVDTVYAEAYKEVVKINSDDYIGSICNLEITCNTRSKHGIGSYHIPLPDEMAHDLIHFVQDYIADKEDV
tara:strand:+ start:261 stop:533 length:273 start_codon:yes stop_codon:yes gene_type:complete